MFVDAIAFNQDLSGWNVSSVGSSSDFATGATAWVLPQPNF
jgi:surface protein